MPTLEKLQQALVNADRAATAGDEGAAADARAIASEIKKLRATSQAATGETRDGKGLLEKVDAGVRGFADLVTWGASDEISAGLGTGFGFLGDYDKELARQRGIDRFDEENNAGSRFIGQLAGGVAQGVGAARAAAPYLVGKSAGLVTGAGMGGGALYGGAYGFGSGEGGAANRAVNAVPNAAIGGFMGAAGPVVARGVGNVAKSVAGSRAADAALKKVGLSSRSADVIRRNMVNDGASSLSIGPNGMLVDASPSNRSTLDAYLQRGGAAVNRARNAIEDRASGAIKSVNATFDQAMGKPQGLGSLARSIREGTKGARSAAYDAAYSKPIDYASGNGKMLESIIKKRVPGSVINAANELMRLDGKESRQILAKIADDGSVTYERLPDVMQIDYITEALSDMAAKSDGAGKLGGQTRLGSKVGNLSSNIRDLTKRLVPEYGEALSTAQSAIMRKNATEFGGKLLRAGTTRDDVLNEVIRAKGKPEVLQAMKQGLRASIDDTLANVRRAVSDPNVDAREAMKAVVDMSSRGNREKVRAVLGKGPAEKVFANLDEAAKALELRASVAANSRTFGRQAANDALKEMSQPGLGRTFIEQGERGGVVEGVKNIIRKALEDTGATAREDQIVGEVVSALTGPRGGEAVRVAKILIEAGVQQDKALAVARSISFPVGGAIVGGGVAAGGGQF